MPGAIPFALAGDSVGYHYQHETNNLHRSFCRSRQEGRLDVLIGRRHPELRPTLHVKDYETPYFLVDKIVVALTFFSPAVVDGLAVGVRKSLDLLESLGMRETWRWLRAKLRGYWYLRGVIDELKSRSAVSNFMHGGPARADLDNRENVGRAGEITHKVGCIGVILSSTGAYKTLQDIMVFCAVILSIGLSCQKRVFHGLPLYSHNCLGIAIELLLVAKV
ncbi:hypothetical protein [Microcoleus vaginatus]|uniref:hypothetical protein n=1 Tax=Microcoleus vaginatus TaxID=119532 RepID=UPI001F61D831